MSFFLGAAISGKDYGEAVFFITSVVFYLSSCFFRFGSRAGLIGRCRSRMGAASLVSIRCFIRLVCLYSSLTLIVSKYFRSRSAAVWRSVFVVSIGVEFSLKCFII